MDTLNVVPPGDLTYPKPPGITPRPTTPPPFFFPLPFRIFLNFFRFSLSKRKVLEGSNERMRSYLGGLVPRTCICDRVFEHLRSRQVQGVKRIELTGNNAVSENGGPLRTRSTDLSGKGELIVALKFSKGPGGFNFAVSSRTY